MTDADNVRERVRSWIKDSGASFEMAVARQMLSVGLGVEQGRYYTDPDENKSREIDVIANTATRIGHDIALGLAAVIECKYAPTPWVLFRQPPTTGFTSVSFDRIATRLGSAFLERAQTVAPLNSRPMFRRETAPGYALSTSNPGTKSDKSRPPAQQDLAYRAVQAVIKASVALANERSQMDAPRWMTTVFPVIAVRGRLFESWLQDDGDVFLAETHRCQLDYSHPALSGGRVLVDIVTETALPQLALDLVSTAGGMVTEASDEAQRSADAVRAADAPVMPRRIR